VASGVTAIPFDNTIPQSNEGDQYMQLVFTPKSASSRLFIDVTANFSSSGNINVTTALFQDANVNAIAASVSTIGGGTNTLNAKFTHQMPSPGIASTTFKVRLGGSSGTTTFNGQGGVGLFGGVMSSSIVIREVL
jgi:hypothetical protein